jgi:hypothetical protein
MENGEKWNTRELGALGAKKVQEHQLKRWLSGTGRLASLVQAAATAKSTNLVYFASGFLQNHPKSAYLNPHLS